MCKDWYCRHSCVQQDRSLCRILEGIHQHAWVCIQLTTVSTKNTCNKKYVHTNNRQQEQCGCDCCGLNWLLRGAERDRQRLYCFTITPSLLTSQNTQIIPDLRARSQRHPVTRPLYPSRPKDITPPTSTWNPLSPNTSSGFIPRLIIVMLLIH